MNESSIIVGAPIPAVLVNGSNRESRYEWNADAAWRLIFMDSHKALLGYRLWSFLSRTTQLVAFTTLWSSGIRRIGRIHDADEGVVTWTNQCTTALAFQCDNRSRVTALSRLSDVRNKISIGDILSLVNNIDWLFLVGLTEFRRWESANNFFLPTLLSFFKIYIAS